MIELLSDSPFNRCPFVKALCEGREADARRLAALPPDPAEPVVIDWLVVEARRQLAEAGHGD